MKTLGKTLKDAREGVPFTLKQVEEATGISNAYISQLENEKIKKPSVVSFNCETRIARVWRMHKAGYETCDCSHHKCNTYIESKFCYSHIQSPIMNLRNSCHASSRFRKSEECERNRNNQVKPNVMRK